MAATKTERAEVPREAYGIGEAAQSVGVSRAFLWKLLADNRGPQTFKIGRRTLISRSALRTWLAELQGDGHQAE